jgi:hypothetical protein
MRCRLLDQRSTGPTARSGEVSLHAQTVRPLTLPSPSGRGFRAGIPRPFPSWSGLSRPSTSSLVERHAQDVDARHKGEHDGEGERRWKNPSPVRRRAGMRCRPLDQRSASPSAAPARPRLMRRPSDPSPCPLLPGEGSASGFRANRMKRWKNPSPGWERGRGEGLPLVGRARRSRCATSLNRHTLIRPCRGTFSHPREGKNAW